LNSMINRCLRKTVSSEGNGCKWLHILYYYRQVITNEIWWFELIFDEKNCIKPSNFLLINQCAVE